MNIYLPALFCRYVKILSNIIPNPGIKKGLSYPSISPSRNDNQQLIKILAKYEKFCPELIQEALTEAVESLENRSVVVYMESEKETYLEGIYKLIDLINETAG